MGAPWVELLRDTIRHACGVTHVVSLNKPTSMFHPRPIVGSGFYAIVYGIPCWLRILNNIYGGESTKRCFV